MKPEDATFLPLRKKKWAISEDECWSVLEARENSCGFLGLSGVAAENYVPYVVPLTFAADRELKKLYFHATMDDDSKKTRAIKENPLASFTVATGVAMTNRPERGACGYSATFTSVMVFGDVEQINDADEKRRILNFLVRQKTTPATQLEVAEMMIPITRVYSFNIRHISGASKK